MNSETRNCPNCHNDFTIESDDFSFYEKIKVPPPTLCVACRTIRRLIFRNERTWYRRVCDATGKNILSMYSPDSVYKVYDQNYWKSDAWDPMDYGQDYNPNQNFFEQFRKLIEHIPHPSMIQKNNVNSDYTNHTLNLKNCYLCVSTDTAEDSSYLFNAILRVKNCMDMHQSSDSEFCYEMIDSSKSSRLFWGQNCEACLDSMLMYDCKNCSDCFGCVGLRNRTNCIFNEQYSKEDYKEKVKQFWNGSYENFQQGKEIFEQLKLQVPRKYANIFKSVNVSGDDIVESRNCFNSFGMRNDAENCKYCHRVWEHSKDGYDAFVAWKGSEMFYDVVSITAQRVYFSAYIWGGFDIYYSFNCFDCNNIFGCVGLRSKSYCIFNQQYTKEQYEELVPKIIENMQASGEYGEFFPAEISPWSCNETVAQDYFPLTKDEAIAKGYRWKDKDDKNYTVTVTTDQVPDLISEIPDSFTNEVIECEHKGKCLEQCSTAFKITKEELAFYKRFNLPAPRLCPFCRQYARIKEKNPMKLWHRSCMKEGCKNDFDTPYEPNRKEVIYCESCYQQEVI